MVYLNTLTKGSRLKDFFLSLFLFFTILYYFLRFQFDLNYYVVSVQITLLLLLGLIGSLLWMQSFIRPSSKQSTIYSIIILYSISLILLTFYRGGLFGFFYSVKDYLLPVMLLFAYKNFINNYNKKYFFITIGLVALAVSTIYVLEYVNTFILLNEYFDYTESLRQLSLSKGNIEENNFTTSFESPSGIFSRLPGPLSHTSSTAIFIAVGILSLLPLCKGSYIFKIMLILCFIALLLTGVRTAWISLLIGFLFYKKARFLYCVYTILIFLVTAILFGFFFPGFTGILEFDRFVGTFFEILSKVEKLNISSIFNFIAGYGFNYPGMISKEGLLFRPILDDDLFILQIFTMYGVIPVFMFFYYLFFSKNNSHYIILNDKYWRAAKSIILCILVSAFHTNAMVRPQIFPVFIFFVVMADQIANHYRYKFSLQSSLK